MQFWDYLFLSLTFKLIWKHRSCTLDKGGHFQEIKLDLNFVYLKWEYGMQRKTKVKDTSVFCPPAILYTLPNWSRLHRKFLVFTSVIVQNRNLQQLGFSSSEYSKHCFHIWALQLVHKVAESRQSFFPVIKLCSRSKVVSFLPQLVIFCKNLLSYNNISNWY